MIGLSEIDDYMFALIKSNDSIIQTWQPTSDIIKIDNFNPIICIGEGNRNVFKEHFMIYASGNIRFKNDLLYTEGSSLTLWYNEFVSLLKLSELCRIAFHDGQIDSVESVTYDSISNDIKSILTDYGNIKLGEVYYENILR